MTGRQLGAWERGGDWPSVAIITLNFRRPDLTVRLLESLDALDYPGPLEVLVVENGSGDGSRELLAAAVTKSRTPARLLVNEKNRGFAGGVLSAWPSAKSDLVCLVNNDAIVHRDCLKRLVEALRGRASVGAVWPLDEPYDSREVETRVEAARSMRNGTHGVLGGNIWLPLLAPGYRECFTGSGVCMMFPRDLVDQPFPEEYFAYFEDVFLGWRLRLRGLAVERVPEAVIFHVGSAASHREPGLREMLATHAEKNRLCNHFVFYAVPTLLALLPLFVLDEARKLATGIAKAVVRHDASYLRLNVRARAWLVRHLRWLLELRAKVQSERVVGDRPLLELMSGRLSTSHGLAGSIANAISLGYCRFAGILTVETRPGGRA